MASVLEFKRPEPPAPKKPSAKSKRAWRQPTKEYVRAEADYEIAMDGAPNVYTSYLKLYGAYPSPAQATAMGQRLGHRLRADDGKHYPLKSKAERLHDKDVRARRKEHARIAESALSVRYALHYLVTSQATDEEVIAYCADGVLGDRASIDRDIDAALDRLQRFAATWRARHPVKQDLVPPR